MSNVNEPEGALKLASALVRDQIRTGNLMRGQMQQMAELLGRTVVLAEMLDENGNGEVVMIDPEDSTNSITVAEQLEGLRGTLLSFREMDAALDEQLGGAQMLYDRFLEKYTKDEG